MREKRTDSGNVLQYSGAQEEVVPVGSSQPQRPQVFLNITPLVKHGNALYASACVPQASQQVFSFIQEPVFLVG